MPARRFTVILAAIAALAVVLASVVMLERQRAGLLVEEFRLGETPVTLWRRADAPAGPLVVVAHGYAGSRQLMQPIAIALAVIFGVVGGNIAGMTKVWDKHWKRVAIVAVMGFFLSFGAKTLEREWYVDGAHPVGASAGILGALAMSGVTAYFWENGKGYLSTGKEKHFAHDVEATLAFIWANLAQPLLFGVVGSYLDFRRMPGITILKAVLTVFIGVSFRE